MIAKHSECRIIVISNFRILYIIKSRSRTLTHFLSGQLSCANIAIRRACSTNNTSHRLSSTETQAIQCSCSAEPRATTCGWRLAFRASRARAKPHWPTVFAITCWPRTGCSPIACTSSIRTTISIRSTVRITSGYAICGTSIASVWAPWTPLSCWLTSEPQSAAAGHRARRLHPHRTRGAFTFWSSRAIWSSTMRRSTPCSMFASAWTCRSRCAGSGAPVVGIRSRRPSGISSVSCGRCTASILGRLRRASSRHHWHQLTTTTATVTFEQRR